MASSPLSAQAPPQRPDSRGHVVSSHDGSSHVREKTRDDDNRATRRVLEYLKVLGLGDPIRARTLALSCAAETREADAELHARAAVRLAMDRVAEWKASTFGELGGEPDALWLRAFVAAHPHAFLADPTSARQAARGFGDASSGRAPRTASFSEQRLGRPRLPDWLHGLWPPLLLGAGVAGLLATESALAGGWTLLRAFWLGLSTVLFAHAAIGFWTAWTGFRTLGAAHSRSDKRAAPHDQPQDQPRATTRVPGPLRVAVAIPIYHEDAGAVFARVAAMQKCLLALTACPESAAPSGGDIAFEMFVLSDSQDPLIAAEEERAFRRVTASAGGSEDVPLFYRRRRKNERQKAGNLGEFFERFGERYEYVVVLDADSLMRGETIAELVRRIDGRPRVALLQAPIVPVGGETLLARSLQWGTSVAGPLFTRGLSEWSGKHGNYYGHNAVIRTRAFLECCALPALSGAPPLGGPLLSHDFVEAALLCRAGWEVRAAPDLQGSYEGLPPTLADYLVRDRRWCQGNLQHLRVALSPGLTGMSRIHLLLGAAAYLAGPAWLAFALVSLEIARSEPLRPVGWASVVPALLVPLMLLGPRMLGLVATLREPVLRRQHGGVLRLFASFFLEAIGAAALSPILMIHHARGVLWILFGRAVGWTAQRRNAGSGCGPSVRGEIGTTLLGLGWLAAVASVAISASAPELLLWFAPVWLPLSLAMAIAALASSAWLGRLLERAGLLLVPSETEPDPIVLRAEELRSLTEGDLIGRFRDLILDPVLATSHLSRLGRARQETPGVPESFQPLALSESELCQRALRVGPAGLSERERQTLLGAPACVRFLHQEAWCHWPIENWQIARESPQLPAAS